MNLDVEPCVMSRVRKRRCWAAFSSSLSSLPQISWIGVLPKLRCDSKEKECPRSSPLSGKSLAFQQFCWSELRVLRGGKVKAKRGSLASEDMLLITSLCGGRQKKISAHLLTVLSAAKSYPRFDFFGRKRTFNPGFRLAAAAHHFVQTATLAL